MAGQLGLDPPTMALHEGGVAAELEKALENSEAVAKCFKCSISASTIIFVIYCSTLTPPSERFHIQEKLDVFLKQINVSHFHKESTSEALNPIFLYVLVPGLPKGYISTNHFSPFSHHVYAIVLNLHLLCFFIRLPITPEGSLLDECLHICI